jgi:hypothetical protein
MGCEQPTTRPWRGPVGSHGPVGSQPTTRPWRRACVDACPRPRRRRRRRAAASAAAPPRRRAPPAPPRAASAAAAGAHHAHSIHLLRAHHHSSRAALICGRVVECRAQFECAQHSTRPSHRRKSASTRCAPMRKEAAVRGVLASPHPLEQPSRCLLSAGCCLLAAGCCLLAGPATLTVRCRDGSLTRCSPP